MIDAVRCPRCDKLLFKGVAWGKFEIKCNRCGLKVKIDKEKCEETKIRITSLEV